MTRRYLLVCLLATCRLVVAQDKWQSLFDGKTLKGWQTLPPSKPLADGDWSVQNGVILCPGTTPGRLASDAAYSDFHLKVQFRGDAKVNSGVFLRSNDYDITAIGDHYVVLLNGAPLLDAHDSAHLSGVIGFQCQVDNKIEFRNIQIMPLHH